MALRETTLEKIIFKNDEGFIIALGKDKLTYKGTVLENPKDLLNTAIEFDGKETEYKGNPQFAFSSYKVRQSFTDFFLEKMVKGLSKTAIVDIKLKCGDNFEKIINENPKALLSIKGIGEKSIDKIIKSYNENKHLKGLADFLLPFSITNNEIKKIHDSFGDTAIETLTENPYKLTCIKGLSFKKVDVIAVKLGLPLNSNFRLNSGIEFAMEDYFTSNGHTCISEQVYFEKSSEILNTEGFVLTRELFLTHLNTLIGFESVTKLSVLGIYTNKRFYNMEKYIFDTFNEYKKQRLQESLVDDIETYLHNVETLSRMKLDEKQKDAIRLVNAQYRCVYLAGFAGTGKSTSSKNSMKLYEDKYGYSSVVGCALSGIAAKRIQTVTGYKSYTIHTLLGFRGGSDFEFNEENKLPYRFIMIDEASMIDTYLFYKLLKAIDLDTTAILVVGDPSQLKAVSPGNIFEDIIDLKLLFGVKLEKVFRQTEEQMINVFATNFIRNGLVPQNYKATGYSDFTFHTHELQNSFQIKNSVSKQEYSQLTEGIKDEILEKIKILAHQHLDTLSYWKTDVWKFITNFQVITPMKGGKLGAENLNNTIQSIFNPNRAGESLILNNGKTFRFRDKVIHLKNQKMKTVSTEEYKKFSSQNILKEVLKDEDGEYGGLMQRVFNGQLGVIVNINLENDVISVYYPNENYIALYTAKAFAERTIDLGYAITIHKSQGMEYNHIVIPMSSSHYVMLNNNLLYTAVTRAKDNLHLVGETFAFERACKNKEEIKRNSILQHLKGVA